MSADKAKVLAHLVQQVQQLATAGRTQEPDSLLMDCKLGDATVMVEFACEQSEAGSWDEPGYPATAACVSVLVNGEWIDPQDVIDASVIARWEAAALEALGEEVEA